MINKNEHLPFNQRMEKRCCNENAYYKYRKNRVELLEDHESKVEEEPFHIRYLRSLSRFSSKANLSPVQQKSTNSKQSPGKMSEALKVKQDNKRAEAEKKHKLDARKKKKEFEDREKARAEEQKKSISRGINSDIVDLPIEISQKSKPGYFDKFMRAQGSSRNGSTSSSPRQFITTNTGRKSNFERRQAQLKEYENNFRPQTQNIVIQEINKTARTNQFKT